MMVVERDLPAKLEGIEQALPMNEDLAAGGQCVLDEVGGSIEVFFDVFLFGVHER